MKERVGILTDTNSGITMKQAEKLGVHLVPMPVLIDGETYFEEVTLTQGEFFKRLAAGANVSTSQPAIGKLMEVWNSLLERYEELVFQPMSSGLSSSCEIAKKLSEEPEFKGRVFVVDNKRISLTLRQSTLEAKALADAGKSGEEIAEYLERTAMEASIYVAVNTLEYLKRSGRVTPAGAALGSVLNIKPVLQIQGGKLDAYKKVRGMNNAMRTMIEAIKNDKETRFADAKKLSVRAAYSGDPKFGEVWRAEVQRAFPKFKVEKDALPISISCHVGDGALGIGIMKTIL